MKIGITRIVVFWVAVALSFISLLATIAPFVTGKIIENSNSNDFYNFISSDSFTSFSFNLFLAFLTLASAIFVFSMEENNIELAKTFHHYEGKTKSIDSPDFKTFHRQTMKKKIVVTQIPDKEEPRIFDIPNLNLEIYFNLDTNANNTLVQSQTKNFNGIELLDIQLSNTGRQATTISDIRVVIRNEKVNHILNTMPVYKRLVEQETSQSTFFLETGKNIMLTYSWLDIYYQAFLAIQEANANIVNQKKLISEEAIKIGIEYKNNGKLTYQKLLSFKKGQTHVFVPASLENSEFFDKAIDEVMFDFDQKLFNIQSLETAQAISIIIQHKLFLLLSSNKNNYPLDIKYQAVVYITRLLMTELLVDRKNKSIPEKIENTMQGIRDIVNKKLSDTALAKAKIEIAALSWEERAAIIAFLKSR